MPIIKVDIYVAGFISVCTASRKTPYVCSSEIPSRYAVAHEALPSILTQRREVPCALAATVVRAPHRDAVGRFPSAQAVQLHLKAVLGGMARPATPMDLARWINDLMSTQTEKPTPTEGAL